jgi:amino acid transporter
LNRKLGWFSNFAISFSIISILAGGMTSYWLGMATGGPRVITLGWIIVASSPCSSAWQWARSVRPIRLRAACTTGRRSWRAGTVLGVVVHRLVQPARADRRHRQRRLRARHLHRLFVRMFDDGFKLTVLSIYGIFVLVLIAHGLLNTFGVGLVKILGDISVWWHVVGVVIIFFVLLISPSNTRGLSGAFDKAPPGLTGWNGGLFVTVYLFALGLFARPVHDHRFRCICACQ